MRQNDTMGERVALILAVVWFGLMLVTVTAKGHEQPDDCWDIQECDEVLTHE